MFIIKTLLGLLWFVIVSIFGFFYAMLFWGSSDTNHHYAKWFSSGILKIFDVKVRAENSHYLNMHSPCVYVVNHQSNIDLITYASICPRNTVVIGKRELLWIPFFGLYFVAAGNLLIHRQMARKAQAGLRAAIQKVKKNKVSIWIFPEGTRNLSGEGLLPFKRGAFILAVQCQIPIVPIVGAPLTSLIDPKSHQLRSDHYQIQVLEPISTLGMTESDISQLMIETRQKMLDAYTKMSERV